MSDFLCAIRDAFVFMGVFFGIPGVITLIHYRRR